MKRLLFLVFLIGCSREPAMFDWYERMETGERFQVNSTSYGYEVYATHGRGKSTEQWLEEQRKERKARGYATKLDFDVYTLDNFLSGYEAKEDSLTRFVFLSGDYTLIYPVLLFKNDFRKL